MERSRLRFGAPRSAARGRRCDLGTHDTMAAAPSRVYFLPSGCLGALSLHNDAGPRVSADRRGGNGYVSAYDARRIDRGIRAIRMSLGPLMIDVAGAELSPDDADVLRHPLVGSVLLFSRNYRNPRQLAQLTAAIRALRTPQLLIAVDHEGGRVQRFRDGFTRLPASHLLGRRFDEDRSDRKSTRLNSSHLGISYAVFCL